jgi:hypothetical protein
VCTATWPGRVLHSFGYTVSPCACDRVQRHACVYHENLIRLGTRGAGSGRGVLGTSCVTLFSCTNVPYPCVVESPRRFLSLTKSPAPMGRRCGGVWEV